MRSTLFLFIGLSLAQPAVAQLPGTPATGHGKLAPRRAVSSLRSFAPATGVSSAGAVGSSAAGAVGISSSGASWGVGATPPPVPAENYRTSASFTRISGYVASNNGSSIVIMTSDNQIYRAWIAPGAYNALLYAPGASVQATLSPGAGGVFRLVSYERTLPGDSATP